MSTINSTNEKQLSPTSPLAMDFEPPLTNIHSQTTEPLPSNEPKLEASDTTSLLANQQVETEKPVTTLEQTNKNETAESSGSPIPTTSQEITGDKSDKTKSENETGVIDTQVVETKLPDQHSLIKTPTEKDTPTQTDRKIKPSEQSLTPITKMCTVRLEILTEADIVKHVHVYQGHNESNVVPVKTDKPVETVETAHFTRSRSKPKSTHTSRLP